MSQSLRFEDLGTQGFEKVWKFQENYRDEILAGQTESKLFFVEHPPTFSMGRGEKGENLKQSEKAYQDMGIDMAWVNRGGKVTYHGPGQLVAYPVFDLKQYRMGVKQFVCALEKVLISTLAEFGLQAHTQEGLIGTWLGTEKIASIGIHVKKSVSIHGLALNVCPDMRYFSMIEPCGIRQVQMTSMKEQGCNASVKEVSLVMAEVFAQHFGGHTRY
ncbi:MAG: lipoyl(octanoyl) transferase LipB [Bdellovibrionales bacterium]|nr:lipoyl(octanoyl) transferase LipB [Bdellovibrionales bacterium]